MKISEENFWPNRIAKLTALNYTINSNYPESAPGWTKSLNAIQLISRKFLT